MTLDKILKYSTILVLLPALYTGFYPGKIVIVNNACMLIFCVLLLFRFSYLKNNEHDSDNVFKLYVLFLIITYIRGFFNLDYIVDYYEQVTMTFVTFLLPSWMLLATRHNIAILWKSFMTIGVAMCFLMTIYEPTDAMMSMAHNMLWLNVFIFLRPYVQKKYYLIVLALALYIVFFDLDRRSIMLGYVVPLVILLVYKFIRTRALKRMVFYTIAAIPMVLIIAFATKTFNVFEYMEDSNQDTRTAANGRALFEDSRTGIYQDVIDGISKGKDWKTSLFGLGGNGKVKTINNGYDTVGMEGFRNGQESGMLNYIQHGGIFGCIAYSLLILVGVHRCIFRSRNDFMLMLGYFLLFKYVYSFIEDTVTYNGHTYYQFLWYGMAYNRYFRSMTNQEFKAYIRNNIFNFSSKKRRYVQSNQNNI